MCERKESVACVFKPSLHHRLRCNIHIRDVTPESEEDEEEGVEWGRRMYGVRMSPAHPRYVGRGDDTCGGEVVCTILEIRTLM